MQQLTGDGSFPRREFLRRSALGTVALAALGAGLHTAGAGSVLAQLVDDQDVAMPDHPVAAVAVLGGQVMAVGGVRGDARVWQRSGIDRPWNQVAGPEAFPQGTALTGLAVDGRRVVAVGCSGTGHATRPRVFSSHDLRSWSPEMGIPEIPGILTGIAFAGGRGLAVGVRFAEPDVEEPVETIAFRCGPARRSARRWVRTTLHGVRPVHHGSVTLLAGDGDRLVLGLTDVQGMAIYAAPGVEGPWRSIGAPRVDMPVAPVATTSVGGSTLLAGIDAHDRARFWRLAGRSWIEVGPPAGVERTVKVHSLRRDGSDLLVAGSRGHAGFLREVKVS